MKKEIFSQAPCISQAPFHAPIRGGYRDGARLPKMDCSDTTQGLQVSLEGRFKKKFFGLNVGHFFCGGTHFFPPTKT